VWRGAREAIVVNASAAILKQAAECTRLGPTFTQDYSPFTTLKSVLNELLIRSGYLLAIGTGLLLTAAFPKISIAGFAWVAPALMIAAAYGKRGCDAFRVGYVAGLAHFLSSLYWLLLIPVTGYPILGWVALGAYVALFPAIWVWLISNSRFQISYSVSWAGRALWSFGGAAIWVALEMVADGCSAAFRGIRWARRNINWFRSFKSRRLRAFMAFRFWSCGFRFRCFPPDA